MVRNVAVFIQEKDVMSLLTAKGDTPEDKLRLLLIFYLTSTISDQDLTVRHPKKHP